jgi:CBS domain containing-hemolysin-like protein
VLALRIASTVALVALSLAWIPLPDWASLLVVAPIVALVPEVAARAFALRFAVAWARLCTWPLLLLHLLLWPIRRVTRAITRLAEVSGTPESGSERASEAEIRTLIARGTAAGTADEREREVVEAVFEFGELTVGRLMTPRPDIVGVSLDAPWDELLVACKNAGFSRIPVWHKRNDEVVGVLLLKDLLQHRAAGASPTPAQLRALLVPPAYVPQSKPANDMLREFLLRRQHMAFAVDEHGTLVGLITLDDLLRELVGEFLDREPAEENGVVRVEPGLWKVKAWTDLDDFAEATGIQIPRDEGFRTVGGFVFHQLGRLPQKGDGGRHAGHRFVVAAMEGRRVAEVHVQRLQPGSEASVEPSQPAAKPAARERGGGP